MSVQPVESLSETVSQFQDFPEIDLRQLLHLTDDTGIFQHAIYGLPDPNHGYCIDDNVRAMIAGLLHAQLRGYNERVVPVQRYLTFVTYAFNENTRKFRNFMSYDRRWLEDEGSQDSQGRAIWGLGLAVELAPNDMMRELATDLLNKSIPAIEHFQFLRSWAFSMLGLDALLKVEPGHEVANDLFRKGADKLWQAWQQNATNDWPWWEDEVTYDNAKLSHALLIAGQRLSDKAMQDAAIQSLDWLVQVQTSDDGHLSIIGNNGWLQKGKPKADFDQQPLEAYALVHGCLLAADVTDDPKWARRAWMCFEWFRGNNDVGIPLYHPDTGGCQDGLKPDCVNKNQGAESSLAYLLSVLELHLFREKTHGWASMDERQPLGYAIASASDFAVFCMDNYGSLQAIEPTAVWNRTTSKAVKLAEDRDVKAFEQLQELVEDASVDIVHVAGIPSLHAEQALIALQAGKHVLCEKPIATTRVDGQSMIETAKKRDAKLAVNLCMRYSPIFEAVRSLFASQVLGKMLRGYVTNRAGDSGLPEDHWFWNPELSGGIFVEHGVHFFDLVSAWMRPMGAPQVASAFQLHRDHQPKIVDQVGCDVRYGSESMVSFYHGFHQSEHFDQQDYRFVFERGELRLENWVPSKLTLNAVLSESQIEQVNDLLPDAESQTVRQLDASQPVSRRGRREQADRQVQWTYADPRDKQTIYGQAVNDLMADFVDAIRRPSHAMRVTAEDALAGLNVALDADHLARKTTR